MLDKSALLFGVSKYLEKGIITGNVLIHKSLLTQLENESNEGLVSAEIALDEVKKVKEVTERILVNFEIVGDDSKRGEVNEVTREYCTEKGCTIVTADEIQRKICEIMGLQYYFLQPVEQSLSFESFFDEETMSVHIKEDTVPRAKKGKPGNWKFVNLSDKPMFSLDVRRIANEIINAVRFIKGSFIEIERKGSLIIQLGNYRVVITRPPLSDGWEITITRPVVRKRLEEYNLDERLIKRLEERAEGIIIAGAPGMGKTTFAQALAEYYMRLGKIVKTIESPRDMHLPPEITQYSKNYAEIGELHDILLLSRPDYTVYDEMRNDEDFKLYVDLRLAGVGMIGVVHATSPIDAIHRFVNRVDIGTIPNILDTIIFIHSGNVSKVYTLEMTVKVPAGLKEADLARPVVEIKDLATGNTEYEIYVFGEQTMIVPVNRSMVMGNLEFKISKIVNSIIPNAMVRYEDGEYVIVIPREEIGKYNRKLVQRLKRLEKKNNIKIKIKLSD
ncbi:PINc/VapC family ATPase [Sulfolobus tengchongensis]|uniref:PINc/VapC family ATPase n=1 Tax=Sulfolobus tengchongensis TaxID=207809 RepID=A0AAX4L3V3_9CREN